MSDTDVDRLVSQVPQLGTNARDVSVEVFKLVVGPLPLIGPAAGAATAFLPGQKVDRVGECLAAAIEVLLRHDKALAEMLRRLDESEFAYRRQVFETGLIGAWNSAVRERSVNIGRVVGHGLAGDESDAIGARRVLRTLDALDDEEFALLQFLAKYGGHELRLALSGGAPIEDAEWFGRGKDDPSPLPVEIAKWKGGQLSLALSNLTRLGLVRQEVSPRRSREQRRMAYSLAEPGRILVQSVRAPPPNN